MSEIYVILQRENHRDRGAVVMDEGYTSREAADSEANRLTAADYAEQAKRGYPNSTLYHYYVIPVVVKDSGYTDPLAV